MACRGCHLDHEQLDYGCNSRNFQQRWLLAFTFRFVDQLALFSGGRPRHTICRAWYQEYEALHRETLENLGRSPSAETHGRMVFAMKAREGPNTSRKSRASHGDDWPPLRGDDGHLSSTWYCWQGGWQSSNTQWALRQLWKKCGVHFVILPIYQEDETLHRETFENLASYPSAEKHMCMVSLENLGRSRSAEKHMRIVSAVDRLVAATGHWPPCHPPRIAEEVDVMSYFTSATSAGCS